MKVVRVVNRSLWVPSNPELPSAGQKLTLVQKDGLALVPNDFNHEDLKLVHNLNGEKKKKK